MVQEKSAIEKLQDFALNSGRQIDFSENKYPKGTGIHPRLFSLNHAIISDKLNQSGYFVSYRDSKGIGDSANYSGFFFPIEVSDSFKIRIRKKNILDKLNPFLKSNSFKSLYYNFSSKVVIEENDISLTNRIFNNKLIQELTLEILSLDERIRVGVNNIQVDVVPNLKGKTTFGIYITGQWMLDETLLETLFILTEKLRKEVI